VTAAATRPVPTMRALVVRGKREHAVEEVPRPALAEGEALVEVSHVAVCGTDLKLLAGDLHDAHYPVIPGHEWAGHVVAAPTRPELVGRAVVGEGITPCGRCAHCARAEWNLCTDLDEVGFTRPGAAADVFTLPAANLRPLPEQLSGPEGCLLEPLGVALHAVERAPALAGAKVGVIGAGTIGLLVGQLAARAGAAALTLVEPAAARRELAGSLGLDSVPALADWRDDPPEVVFDATGVAAVFPDGLRATRAAGTYVLVGYSGEAATTFEPSSVMLGEYTVRGVLSGYGQVDRAIELAVAGAVRLAPLVSEILPLSDYRAVLEPRPAAPLRTVFTP
jgi:2-desacetyl-2-hydroxyethyl bacteriochlorophyllide A dehydrogenase